MKNRVKVFEMWWPGTELNRRRQPFQGCALPPELPGHVCSRPRDIEVSFAWTRQKVGGVDGIRSQETGAGESSLIINNPRALSKIASLQCRTGRSAPPESTTIPFAMTASHLVDAIQYASSR